MDGESAATTCGACEKARARYACPKCGARLCALACYERHNDGKCQSRFHEDALASAMRGMTATAETKREMMETLRRRAVADGTLDLGIEEEEEEEEGDEEEGDMLVDADLLAAAAALLPPLATNAAGASRRTSSPARISRVATSARPRPGISACTKGSALMDLVEMRYSRGEIFSHLGKFCLLQHARSRAARLCSGAAGRACRIVRGISSEQTS